jgi:hypothetical protein
VISENLLQYHENPSAHTQKVLIQLLYLKKYPTRDTVPLKGVVFVSTQVLVGWKRNWRQANRESVSFHQVYN